MERYKLSIFISAIQFRKNAWKLLKITKEFEVLFLLDIDQKIVYFAAVFNPNITFVLLGDGLRLTLSDDVVVGRILIPNHKNYVVGIF